MRFHLLIALLLPAVLLGQAFKPEGLQKLDAVLDRAVAKKSPAGAVVWLEHAGTSHTVVKGARALSPAKETMTLDTVFDAASLTKVVATAPAILLLGEQGKVDIETPVSRYLPEFIGEGRELVKVRHLLTHTSGLKPGLPREPAWSGYEAGIRLAVETVPDAAPDTFFRYSDINYILLGDIVRRVSGEKLDVFVQKHLFLPLKMISTRYLPPAEWQGRIAPTEKDANGVMLRGDVHDPTARRMGGVAGHAGLFTCAEDLAQFARMILNGGELDGVRIFKGETLDLMKQVQTAATVYERRGLGWDIDSAYSRPRGELFPVGSFGHTGFTGTSLWMDPYSNSFVIFLSSRLHPNGGGSVRDLYEEIGTAAAQCIPGYDFTQVTGALVKRGEKEVPTVLNGIDVLKRDGYGPLNGLRVGLITNQTGMDAQRTATIDLLAKAPKVKLRALFSPEHGIRGALDQEKIGDSVDRKTGRPIYSLYGERRAPTVEQLEELDALVFDIQDIGCRFYTYISTLRMCLEAAARSNKKFFVLDRVNPVGGTAVEGPAVVDKETFTATHAIPIRHGMTVGELAQMMNAERHIGADLEVIRAEGWRRELLFDQTGLPWVNPSPNMRTLDAALLYPGIGLLEFSISVGRGTDAPFEILGAPYVNDRVLSYELNKLGLPGLRFMPVRFKPSASVFKDEECGGVRIQITDREALRPVQTGVAIATVFQRFYPKSFNLEKVNTLLNHAGLLKTIRTGKSWREMRVMWEAETAAFEVRRAGVLLY
ncbi:exo-beta-N-acetylmuramidase NamZ domain-containing protein [Prosthecobacter sp. SYSU 5D2]|uniref:exo-beta-N-acetylmuramidase NamZ domain-containing protein n=1 Tax=Prosthecobacter sp. SYSU 5D2 TaxID=3134134 RepID=UPI0031FED2CD